MDAILKAMDNLFGVVQDFGLQEWGIIAAITCAFGYLCLRGMNIR